MVNKEDFSKYIELFLVENSKVNLISKKDEEFLWQKHIYDSLSIGLFFDKFSFMPKSLLDIGTGGGFPSVPIAIAYPDIEVVAVDSIGKKIRAIESLKENLGLKNLTPICSRVESLDTKFDLVTTRAVSSLKNVCEYALPKLNKGGYFVAYKSKKVNEEIIDAQVVLKKYKAKIVEVIEYNLPLEEVIDRNLVVIAR